ncbi:MAG: hypothetical protein K0S07_920 [Chlamydiales bacterium]|jgi:hypothetical protein|nr:hypothetical protein [Chlamydiales bacterium]
MNISQFMFLFPTFPSAVFDKENSSPEKLNAYLGSKWNAEYNLLLEEKSFGQVGQVGQAGQLPIIKELCQGHIFSYYQLLKGWQDRPIHLYREECPTLSRQEALSHLQIKDRLFVYQEEGIFYLAISHLDGHPTIEKMCSERELLQRRDRGIFLFQGQVISCLSDLAYYHYHSTSLGRVAMMQEPFRLTCPLACLLRKEEEEREQKKKNAWIWRQIEPYIMSFKAPKLSLVQAQVQGMEVAYLTPSNFYQNDSDYDYYTLYYDSGTQTAQIALSLIDSSLRVEEASTNEWVVLEISSFKELVAQVKRICIPEALAKPFSFYG